eukprot:10487403-Ditylum_brightwellii.AAC.1
MAGLAKDNDVPYDTTADTWKELEELMLHAAFCDYKESVYNPFVEKKNVKGASLAILMGIMGNFNADSCLVAGRTIDYGLFHFMGKYHPLFAKWTGSGEDWMKEEQHVKKEILTEAQEVFQEEIDCVFCSKLGFDQHEESGSDLWSELEPILFWRCLTMVMKEYPSLDSTAY